MFEIQDERIGRLKIFNVTEARANFADVLKEGDAKVVVTRHGRPKKILIRYEEYLELLAAAGQDAPEEPTLQPTEASNTSNGSEIALTTEDTSKPVPPKWVQRESEQIVDSLRGLLK